MALDWPTIITSAAVGSVVGSGISLAGQILESRSRRRELLLAKAVELGIERARFAFDVANKQGKAAAIEDSAVMAATYFRWLEHLLDRGVLPNDPQIKKLT